MSHDPHENSAPEDSDRGHPSEADRKSKVPKRPQDTDAEGNALNDMGEDNHTDEHAERND